MALDEHLSRRGDFGSEANPITVIIIHAFYHWHLQTCANKDVKQRQRLQECVAKLSVVADNETLDPLRMVPDFRFLTNHGNTLLLIARDPRLRIREIASLLDVPERAAQRIVSDLVKTGYIDAERQGRRNVYSVRSDRPFNLPFQRDVDINALLGILSHIGDPSDAVEG